MANSTRATLARIARLWTAPLWLGIVVSGATDTVRYDVSRWVNCIGAPDIAELDAGSRFAYLAAALGEFRTLVHYRLRGANPVLRALLRAIYRPSPVLVLDAREIGPGLFIQHGTASHISAVTIGRDCWINQQVTIGYNTKGCPTLGDNVRIGAGAVVFGPIRLNDGATVGANATVMRDVPANGIVVAPPAVPLESLREHRPHN
jgi:serine O-acetyltransferase